MSRTSQAKSWGHAIVAVSVEDLERRRRAMGFPIDAPDCSLGVRCPNRQWRTYLAGTGQYRAGGPATHLASYGPGEPRGFLHRPQHVQRCW